MKNGKNLTVSAAFFTNRAEGLLVQRIGALDELREFLVGDVVVLHFAGEILVVGAHVHEAVAGEVEEDGLLLARLLALEGLLDGGGDGMAGLRSGDDAFGAGEQDAGREGILLLDVHRLHEAVLHQLGEDDAGTVVAQAARVDGVYTADPEKDPTAVKYDELTFDEAISKHLKVMDQTAYALCSDGNMPIIVFDMNATGNLTKLIKGEKVGTLVHP